MKTVFAKSALVGITLLGVVCTTSCSSDNKRTGIGAGAGAVGGGVVGALIGGPKGALIGAGVGAVAGGAVGNILDRQAKELAQVADTKRTQDGILVKLKNDLLFDTNSASLKPDARDQLIQLGDILVKYPQDRIHIVGYTDSTGSAQHNLALSQSRAQAVHDVLIQRGVKGPQLITDGEGESQPIASNSTAQGRSQNRRVELKIDVPNQAGQKG